MLPGKTLTPLDLFRMARRRAWLIAVPPLVCFYAALLYSSTLINLYQSDMLIAVDPQRVPDSFVRSTVTLETDRRMDAITVQVLSRTNLERMIETLGLYPDERRTLPMEDVVRKMRAAIRVEMEVPRPRPGMGFSSSAFHIRFTHPDPNVAAQVTQQLGSLFVDQNARDRDALAGATNRFLGTQLGQARARLEEQERKLEAFRQRHGKALPTQLQTNIQALASAQQRAQSLMESIARDNDRRQMLDRLYRDALNEPPATTATPALQSPTGPAAPLVRTSARQQLAEARASLASLELRYRSDHPDVIRTKRLITQLEPKAAAEAAATAAASTSMIAGATTTVDSGMDVARRDSLRQMRAEIESLDRQTAFKEAEELKVRSAIADYQQRIEAVPGLESEWIALTRDYDTHQAAYRDLLAKSTASQVAVELEAQDIGERFRIVDAARVPVHPLQSLRVRYNLGGFAVGLMLGVGLAAVLEIRDATFRSDNDVLEVLGLPVLASVPRVETASEKLVERRRRLALSLTGAACVVAGGYIAWTLKLWNSLI